MGMLTLMCGPTIKFKIRNIAIQNKIEVVSATNKMKEVRLRLFGYAKRSCNCYS